MSIHPRTCQVVLPRQYHEFDPETGWLSSEEGAETLIVHLPGFQKGQLIVEPTPTQLFKISGQRPLGGNRWLRFFKEVQLPLGCGPEEITAKIGGGVLYVRRPKLDTPAPQDKL